MMRLLHIYLSADHNYFGHFGQPPGETPMVEVPEVRCVAGKGLEGDRFFEYKPDYKGQVTFFSIQVYEDLCTQFAIADLPPSVFRRNLIVEAPDLNALVGCRFELQGITFEGSQEAAPCAWMNQAFAEGAEVAMRHRGGLRARILTDGRLRSEAFASA